MAALTPGQVRALEALYVNPLGCIDRVVTRPQFGHVNEKAANSLVSLGLAEWRRVRPRPGTLSTDDVRYYITAAGRAALGKEAKRVNAWDVYLWTAEGRKAEWIGMVGGDHQPGALKAARLRWPDLGKATQEYPNARLIVRRAGDVTGMPCDVVRSSPAAREPFSGCQCPECPTCVESGCEATSACKAGS